MRIAQWFRKSARTYRLGPLEQEMLEAVWAHGGETTVRDLLDGGRVRIAYTTAMTTLDRLHKKGLLNRRKAGRAFAYSASLTRAEFGAMLAREAVDLMISYADPQSNAVFSHFVESISESDSVLLDALERAVKSQRKRERRS